MRQLSTHSIRVLGRDLQVKSAASAQHVAEVEALVNAKLAEAEKTVNSGDTQLVVILAMMNIAEAYLAARAESKAGEQELTGRIAALLRLVESRVG